jgi:hypothetical protein
MVIGEGRIRGREWRARVEHPGRRPTHNSRRRGNARWTGAHRLGRPCLLALSPERVEHGRCRVVGRYKRIVARRAHAGVCKRR